MVHFDHEALSAILIKSILFKINRNNWTRMASFNGTQTALRSERTLAGWLTIQQAFAMLYPST